LASQPKVLWSDREFTSENYEKCGKRVLDNDYEIKTRVYYKRCEIESFERKICSVLDELEKRFVLKAS